ncbi:hypothetical protein OEZ49_20435 [Ruegeria sp. WL0004]|uniref:Plastocyanin-like domain-containing protein n=1 Tax=Ruegeria marisflavi TaxID=2984152 RepID=A0ABT2WW71_9RHOB|nr:hypothetical protein [Ruegeria sp. WL0004]MCU9840136.1 hypothetical protein [Ruegeria sp. WL0004]
MRLRLINSSVMAYFDPRIPGLKMTLVQVDGNDVKPVTVYVLQISVTETYDVIGQTRENLVYSIVAESVAARPWCAALWPCAKAWQGQNRCCGKNRALSWQTCAG